MRVFRVLTHTGHSVVVDEFLGFLEGRQNEAHTAPHDNMVLSSVPVAAIDVLDEHGWPDRGHDAIDEAYRRQNQSGF
jgi:hypothetical protein